MTDEDRIAKLEHQVRNFRVVTDGGADIFGGFGELKLGQTMEERLNNLEAAVAKFALSGNGVDVFGSFENGYGAN